MYISTGGRCGLYMFLNTFSTGVLISNSCRSASTNIQPKTVYSKNKQRRCQLFEINANHFIIKQYKHYNNISPDLSKAVLNCCLADTFTVKVRCLLCSVDYLLCSLDCLLCFVDCLLCSVDCLLCSVDFSAPLKVLQLLFLIKIKT
jgi:hypothetical protein